MCLLFDVANIQIIITNATYIVTIISIIVIFIPYSVTKCSFCAIYNTNTLTIIGEQRLFSIEKASRI